MRFYGSAMRMPHVGGGFREVLVCAEAQAVPVPRDLPLEHAAFAEPLAVCLHAMGQAGLARALDRYDEAAVVAHTLDLLGLPQITG